MAVEEQNGVYRALAGRADKDKLVLPAPALAPELVVRGEEVIADGAAHGLFVLQLLAVFEAARVEAGRADALLPMLALLQGVSVARALEVARDAIN